MNEEERAEIVARAIDALTSGLDPKAAADSYGELNSLLDIAEERFLGSMFIAKASIQHEQDTWRSVVKRIQESEIEAVLSGEPDEDLEGLGDVIAMRRGLSAEMFKTAEDHREEVWEKVRSRLTDSSRHAGVPDILRSFRRRSDEQRLMSTSADIAAADPVRFRASQAPMGTMADTTHESARERVWAEVSSGTYVEKQESAHAAGTSLAIRPLAIAAAVAALAILLVPLPATGFAEHPLSRLGGAFGSLFVADGAAPPDLSDSPPVENVLGQAATASEASALAGVQFLQPSQTPGGFVLESSLYYPRPVNGGTPGTFVLTYNSEDAALAIYQEPAGGSDLAIGPGSGASVALSDGTPATLTQGSWVPGEQMTWVESGSQSLIFERGRVLVVVEFTAAEPRPTLLFQVAEDLR
jgi:hypothetical protein